MHLAPCTFPDEGHRAARPRALPSARRYALCAALILSPFLAPLARAQGVIAGDVKESGTRQPIAAVQVTIDHTTLGTLTDQRGHFRITGIPTGQPLTVSARRIGYVAQTRAVTLGDTTITFELVTGAISLDEVVVTGTVGGETKREIGNAVTTVQASEVTAIAPIQSLDELINGRAPNVTIIQGSGQVGTGSKIRVRGTSSFDLAQAPLIYIDGVRTDNDQATGPANQSFSSSSVSRWNDIDPEDIERIEIIKGPAAGTLYGTEASNGVVQIITKQGTPGPARWDFSLQQGTNFIMNPQGLWPTNYQNVGGTIESINFTQLNNNYLKLTGNDIFQNGYSQKYRLGVGGGSDKYQYYVSGVRQIDDGAEPSNSLERTSGRANVSIVPSDKIRIDAHLNYISGRTHLAPEAGFGGRVWTTMLMDPATVSDPAQIGFGSNLPYQYDQVYHLTQDLSRFVGSVQISNTPTSWFSHRLIVGADQVNTNNVELGDRIDSLLTPVGSDALGYRIQSVHNDAFRTFDYSATGRVDVGKEFNFATSVGAQYYIKTFDSVSAQGFVFPAPGLTSINALTTGLASAQDVVENRTLGFYAQEQIGWANRRFLTLALRSDKNSAFGPQFSRAYYPKASVSWVISEEPFFHAGFVNSLRLRAAYGETGQQPDQFAALRTYISATGPLDQPAVQALTLGNAQLGPERGKELEAGFETSLFNDRAGFEFSWYNKRTKNAILNGQEAPSVGFGSELIVNAGEIRNRGVELQGRYTPVRGDNLEWDVSASFSYNDNKIVSLGIPGISSLVPARYQEDRPGYAVGAWFMPKIVSATMDPAGVVTAYACDDGHGGSTDCATAPNIFLGNSIPNREGALSTSLTFWKQFRVYALADYQYGQRKLDGNLRIRCFFQIGGVCREMVYPAQYSPILEAGIQNQQPFYLISDAGFVKLRNVSVTYTLPSRFATRLRASAASITVAGRNLHTWTKYKGLDPEVQFLGGSRGGGNVAWDQTATPQLTSFYAMLNLSY